MPKSKSLPAPAVAPAPPSTPVSTNELSPQRIELQLPLVTIAKVFVALLAGVALMTRLTTWSRSGLFWAAFILTRPLGATVGDFLDKPVAKGGLDFSRPLATLALLVAIAVGLWLLPQRAAPAEAAH